MAQSNLKQNMITAVSIIIALIAVVYALMGHVEKPQDVSVSVSSAVESEKSFDAGENNPVVMSINGADITRAQILDNFNQSGSALPQGADLSQIFPLLQEQFLVGYLLEEAAKNAGIDQNNPYVQDRLKETLNQALRAAYIKQIGDNEIKDEDVQKAYDDIIANASPIMERKAHHILVETEGAANALIVKLNNGADFVTLAKENSTGPSSENGGDLGYFAKVEMVPEFAAAAFALNVGEYSKTPVKTQFGYHIIKIDDERERTKPSYEEVKDQLAEQLKQAVIREQMTKLRDNANVTLFDMNGNPIVNDTAQPAIQSNEATTDEEITPESSVESSSQTEELPEVEAEVTE